MADAIRDVIIKIALQAEANGLRGVTSDASAASAALNELTRGYEKLKQTMETIPAGIAQSGELKDAASDHSAQTRSGGRSRRNWGGPPSSEVQAEIEGHRADMAAEGYKYPADNERKRRMKDAITAQNQRETAHKKDEAERHAQRERHQNLAQTVMDNDVANAVKVTNQGKTSNLEDASKNASAIAAASAANEQYYVSSTRAAVGAAEFAKGLAFVVASGDKNDQQMVKAISTAQGYFNIISGGVSTLNALNAALRNRPASSGDSGVGNATGPANSAANVAGTGASAAGSAGGNLASLTNPWTALAAAAVATGVAIRQMAVYVREFNEGSQASNTRTLTMMSRKEHATVLRHADQGMQLAAMTPNYGALRQPLIAMQGRGETERRIREEQEGSTRDFGARQEIRSRREQEQAFTERGQTAIHERDHLNKQEEILKATKSQFPVEQKRSADAHAARMESIRVRQRELQKQLPNEDTQGRDGILDQMSNAGGRQTLLNAGVTGIWNRAWSGAGRVANIAGGSRTKSNVQAGLAGLQEETVSAEKDRTQEVSAEK